MTLHTARLLCSVSDRYDWAQPRLSYIPGAAYAELVRFRHFLNGVARGR